MFGPYKYTDDTIDSFSFLPSSPYTPGNVPPPDMMQELEHYFYLGDDRTMERPASAVQPGEAGLREPTKTYAYIGGGSGPLAGCAAHLSKCNLSRR